MDYADITDKVYDLVCGPILQVIMAQQQQAAPFSCETTLETKTLITEICQSQLPQLLPDCGFWYADQPRPAGNLLWVVSPLRSALMGQTTVSIALQKGDVLLLGVLLNLGDQEVITATIGEGAKLYDKTLTVSQEPLSESTSYAYVDANSNAVTHDNPAYSGSIKKHAKRLTDFTKNIKTRLVYTNEPTNASWFITSVAKGARDFVCGFDFQYPDIAAALCILQQAGGEVSDFSGGLENVFLGEAIFCSNAVILAAFVAGSQLTN